MKELKITKEDIDLLKEMKDNCLKTNVYDDEKRLLKANAITKFLVEHEKKQELITYLKEEIEECYRSGDCRPLKTLQEILSKIEKSDNQ